MIDSMADKLLAVRRWALYQIHNAIGRLWYRLGRVLQYTKRWDA